MPLCFSRDHCGRRPSIVPAQEVSGRFLLPQIPPRRTTGWYSVGSRTMWFGPHPTHSTKPKNIFSHAYVIAVSSSLLDVAENNGLELRCISVSFFVCPVGAAHFPEVRGDLQ